MKIVWKWFFSTMLANFFISLTFIWHGGNNNYRGDMGFFVLLKKSNRFEFIISKQIVVGCVFFFFFSWYKVFFFSYQFFFSTKICLYFICGFFFFNKYVKYSDSACFICALTKIRSILLELQTFRFILSKNKALWAKLCQRNRFFSRKSPCMAKICHQSILFS